MVVGDRGFASMLEDKLTQLLESRATALTIGSCSDYAEYTKACGFLAGLRAALKLCEDTRKELHGA